MMNSTEEKPVRNHLCCVQKMEVEFPYQLMLFLDERDQGTLKSSMLNNDSLQSGLNDLRPFFSIWRSYIFTKIKLTTVLDKKINYFVVSTISKGMENNLYKFEY